MVERILVIEDDLVLSSQIAKALIKDGYLAEIEMDGEAGLLRASSTEFDLILLDVMLPKLDGQSVCRELRRLAISTPVLMLTARDSVDDRVNGLDAGADDYLPKPFAYPELTARIRALLRRDRSRKGSLHTIGALSLDESSQEATVGGKGLHLTRREYDLLVALMRNQGRVLTREIIIEQIWKDEKSLSNTVNFHVNSLRRKLELAGCEEGLIETVHGFGYRINVANS